MRLLQVPTLPVIPLARDRATRATYRLDPGQPSEPMDALVTTTLTYAGVDWCAGCGQRREVWRWDTATSPYDYDASECAPCLVTWGSNPDGTPLHDGWVWAALLMRAGVPADATVG